MKLINAHSTKWMAIATGAILVVGAINVLPWRLVAQETKAPPITTTEAPTNAAQPPAGTARFGRSSATERMPGSAPERMSSRQSLPAPRPPTDVAPARFEATVYEVQVPENRIADLDARALEAKAATSETLAKALADLGKTRVLNKIDQTVNLYGESIMLGTSEPMVTNTRMTASGQSLNSVTYQQVGLIVNFAASAPPKGSPRKGLDVQVNFQMSALADSGVEISPKVKASSIRTMHLNHSETPRFGKPVVLLSVSAPSGDKVPPVAYVVRYVFSETKP
jgi:hypothetical protein